MKKIITSFSRNTASQPTEYEFQKIAIHRKLITSQNELNQFKRIEAGALGEIQFAQVMNDFGLPQWSYLQNIWLKDHATFECDYILVTNHCVYIFEIKNYFGVFEYQNGQCKSRGVDISYNPLNQIHNATVHLKNLLRNYSYNIPVKGVLVFIGEHNKVLIHDDINYIDIISSNEVYAYIQCIIHEERMRQVSINTDYLLKYLEEFEVVNPYTVTPYSPSDITKQHTGLYCKMCAEKLRVTRNLYIECSCGFQEYREHLIVRTACDYGVLTHGTNFVVRDIWHFAGSSPSHDYVKKVLLKHFNIVQNERILTLENYGQPLYNLTNHFSFEKPNRMLITP